MKGVAIYRVSESVIVVDGVSFELEEDGIYRSPDESYRYLQVFDQYIVSFLKIEAILEEVEESKRCSKFQNELTDILLSEGIQPYYARNNQK